MSVFQQMADMLSPLGIYSLQNGSVVAKELTVYANALESLYGKLDSILKEAFVATADSYGIEAFESLFGSVCVDMTLQNRRKRLIDLFTVNGDKFSLSDLSEQLCLYGINNTLCEDIENMRVYLQNLPQTDDPAELYEYLKILQSIAPAELFADVGITTLTWDRLEQLDHSFGEWDRMSLRFDDFYEQED